MALLAEGRTASATLDALTSADDQRDQRQAGAVDAAGNAATYTGTGCHDWAGGVAGTGYAIQGNILTGPEVVAAMEAAWLASEPGAPLGRRLLAALTAGDIAGGDQRGRQSAALLVVTPDGGYGGGSDVYADLRVDDHRDPVPELTRLLDLHDIYFTKPDPEAALLLEGALSEEVRERLHRLGHVDADLDVALAKWAGIENYEERLLPGKIDPVVLENLRRLSS
jgi:uncharacterized Ntn-hydrolase superfamily protein